MGPRRMVGSASRRAVLALAALGGLSPDGPVEAQDPELLPRRFGNAVLLVGATLIDGRGGAPRVGESVFILGGEIYAIGDQSRMDPMPEETRIVRIDGGYLVPGYIDAFAHARDTTLLEGLLAAGVTSVLNPGPATVGDVDFDRLVRSRDVLGPRIFSAGRPIDGPPGTQDSEIVEDEGAARAAVRARVDDFDFVQLSRNLPPDLVLAAVREARAADVPIMGDLGATSWTFAARAGIDVLSRLVSGNEEVLPEEQRQSFRQAVAAGADAQAEWLERVVPRGAEIDAMIGALLSRDTPVAPLLASTEARLLCADPDYLKETALLRPDPSVEISCPSATWSQDERDRAKASWPRALEIVRLLDEQDVRLLAGSDPTDDVLRPGAGFHRELELFVDAGIAEEKVVSIATLNGAIALDRLHEVGTIEAGKRADLILLRTNPLDDIRNLRDIEFVMKDGRFYFAADSERRPGQAGRARGVRRPRAATRPRDNIGHGVSSDPPPPPP